MKSIKCISLLLLSLNMAMAQSDRQSGRVFNDANGNGAYDSGELPLADVYLSNGKDIVHTDKKGRYSISLREGNPVFLIKPSGYGLPLTEDNIPMTTGGFLKRHVQVGNGKKDQVDFPLHPQKEEGGFKVALLGDTQVKVLDDVFYVADLVGEQLIQEKVDFVVPLGDLVFDNLELFGPLKKVLGKIGAPVQYVYGNHDRDYDETKIQFRDRTYISHFGPSYYAFNYGDHTFLVLNTVFPEPGTKKYEGRIDNDQLMFLENYLQVLPKNARIHLMMHIPLENLSNLSELLALFKGHPNVSAYAGHTHTQYFKDFGADNDWSHENELVELVAGAVCGTWWRGEKDIYGVPSAMMRDGTPRGYWIMDLNADSKKLDYKVSGNVPHKQMHIWTPRNFRMEKKFYLDRSIVANIYAGNKDTEVQVRVEGQDWKPMQKVMEPDPYYRRLLDLQESGTTPTDNGLPLGKALTSDHIWTAPIPENMGPGVYIVEVSAKNAYGMDARSSTLLFVDGE
ncbi:MAG: calcineurin-like phosphoesterase family protein [Sediminicola sp.]